MQLFGKAAIVTGGAGGIGGAISRLFVERGAKVVIVDLSIEAARSLAHDRPDSVVLIEGSVTDTTIAARAVATAVERFGHLDTLVNNAHGSTQAPFIELSEADWALSLDSGLGATRNFMLAAYPELRKRGGSVVNFGSGAALDGQPTQASYAAAKEAIRGLSRVVANEWAKDAIRVNVVCPIAMTGGVAQWRKDFPDMYEATRARIPLGRFGDPEQDVAPVVAFLASDDSRYMTGQTLMADGGSSKLR